MYVCVCLHILRYHLEPVEPTLYSATVPIKEKHVCLYVLAYHLENFLPLVKRVGAVWTAHAPHEATRHVLVAVKQTQPLQTNVD